jgi:hypothetical protein
MASSVSEKQAREVVEAAREAEWKLPSFGKELFLGDFRLDLIYPQPRLDPEAVEKGERARCGLGAGASMVVRLGAGRQLARASGRQGLWCERGRGHTLAPGLRP